MAAAWVQSKSATSGSALLASISVTLDAPVGNGNLVAFVVSWANRSEAPNSATDDKSNTYTLVDNVSDTTNDQRARTYYLNNITNAPVTITVSWVGTHSYRAISAVEASGCDTSAPLDQHIGQWQTPTPGTGTDAVTSSAVVPTTDGQFIFGGVVDTSGTHASQFSLGTGFTNLDQAGSASTLSIATESLIQSSAASIAATFTAANADLDICFIMTFKAAAGGAVTSILMPQSVM